ncbi:hypothetical protein, partial [Paraburkholderia sp. BR10879]
RSVAAIKAPKHWIPSDLLAYDRPKSGHLNLAKSGHYNLARTNKKFDNLCYVKSNNVHRAHLLRRERMPPHWRNP